MLRYVNCSLGYQKVKGYQVDASGLPQTCVWVSLAPAPTHPDIFGGKQEGMSMIHARLTGQETTRIRGHCRCIVEHAELINFQISSSPDFCSIFTFILVPHTLVSTSHFSSRNAIRRAISSRHRCSIYLDEDGKPLLICPSSDSFFPRIQLVQWISRRTFTFNTWDAELSSVTVTSFDRKQSFARPTAYRTRMSELKPSVAGPTSNSYVDIDASDRRVPENAQTSAKHWDEPEGIE